MRKTIFALSIVLASIAQADNYIYCPQEIICRGTPDSCYVNNPKNYDGNFIYDSVHHHNIATVDGRYVFTKAEYYSSHNDFSAEGFCQFQYVDGSTNPHIAQIIYFENKIRMQPHVESSASNKWEMLEGRCLSINPSSCPFEIKAK